MVELLGLFAIGSILIGLISAYVGYRAVKRLDRIRRICDAEIERYHREMNFENKE